MTKPKKPAARLPRPVPRPVKAWGWDRNGRLTPGAMRYRADAATDGYPDETVIQVEIRPFPPKHSKVK